MVPPPPTPLDDVEAYVATLRTVRKRNNIADVKAWSTQERIALLKGIKQQIQIRQAILAMEAFDPLTDDPSAFDDRLKSISQQPVTARDVDLSLASIDWDHVAYVYVTSRTPTECRIQWSDYEHPSFCLGQWTKSEDKLLRSLARKHKFGNWDQIAHELGGHKSAAQCLTRYQCSLNTAILRSKWTEEEDKQLRAAVQQCGDHDWQAVAAKLEGRNGAQCWNRWNKVLHPMRMKSGRWDGTEDEQLKMAISVHGARNWKTIATHVPGRTEAQCRERWHNVLDPSLSYGPWSDEEDLRLEEAVMKHGYRWSIVANHMKPRTDNQCWRRWKKLHPNALQENSKIQSALM